MVSSGDRTEIAFFDVETTVPTRRGQKFAILEFGSILVCPKTLMELESYSTLLRPADLSLISDVSVRCNGITRDDVVSAPSFSQIADRVYNILHGRIWAGHNIIRFDCVRVKEAFAEINRPPPEPKGTIDSLALLTQRFGRRAGDMKMASLATYFGLGQQTHRSLDDVRMNLEVLKYCATVLFLESTLPDIFTANSWVSPNATMRSRSNGKASSEGTGQNRSTPSSSSQIENHPTSSPTNHTIGQKHPMLSPMTPVTGKCVLNLVEPNIAPPDPFNMGPLSIKVERESLQPDDTVMEKESTLPDIFTANNWVSPNATMRSRSNGKASPEGTGQNRSTPSSGSQIENHPTSSPTNHIIGEKHPMLSPMTPVTGKCVLNLVESNIAPPDPFNMGPLSIEVERESLQPDDTVMESGSELLNSFTENSSDASGGCSNFLKPDEVSIPSITVVLSPYYHGIQRLQILHKNTVLHVCCSNLKVRFGINTKFVDYAGRPRLNFVMDASPDVCWVLDACDSLAQRMSLDSGSSSDWRPVVTRKAGFVNSPTIRMHLPTVPDGNTARWTTEMYQKESSSTQRIVFSRYDVAELDALFIPGTFVDAYFSLDPYDYQQTAGIRLVAKKLVIHSN